MRNIKRALQEEIEHPWDVAELKRNIHILERFSNVEIQKLYRAFSDEYSASWLILDEERLEEFKNWLQN